MYKYLVACIISIIVAVPGQAVQPEYKGYFSQDNDNTIVQKHLLSLSRETGAASSVGIVAGLGRYSELLRTENTYSFQGRFKVEPAEYWSLAVQGGVLRYGSASLPLFSAAGVYEVPHAVRVEINAEHDVVDTLACLDDHTMASMLGAYADVPLLEHFLLVGGGDVRAFSNGNNRFGLLGKAIVELPVDGLTLQVWHRQFRNSSENTVGYFNPATINFQRYVLSLKKRIYSALRVTVIGGPGSQQVNTDTRTGTVYFEGRLEQNLASGLSFKINYIHSDSSIDNGLLSYKINIWGATFLYAF